MKKFAAIALTLSFLVGVVPVGAQEATTTDTTTTMTKVELLADLLRQIQELQVQLEELQKQRGLITTQIQTLRSDFQNQLRLGITSEEVTTLQEILATDPEIYPEGLVTGYFGPLTEKAVKRFQKRYNIEQVGEVGPQTRATLNRLLTEGAGNSGKVPPGLLIAPGIRKKIDFTPSPLPGQKLPPGIAKKLNMDTGTTTDDGDDTGTTTDDGDDDTGTTTDDGTGTTTMP